MSSNFYTYEFSSNGFGDSTVASDRVLIFILDTSSKNAVSLLESELTKNYMKSCCLLILYGPNSHDFEELADNHLFGWEDSFVPTASSADVPETLALIGGWEIKKPKKIMVVTDSDMLAEELRSFLDKQT